MSEFGLLSFVLRGSLVITAGYLLLPVLLRFARANAPDLRQLGVVLIFAAAVCPWSLPIEVPCLPGETPSEVEELQLSSDETFFLALPELVANSTSKTDGTFENSDAEIAEGFDTAQVAGATFVNKSAWQEVGGFLLRLIWIGGGLLLISAGVFKYVLFLSQAASAVSPERSWQSEWEELQRSQRYKATIPLFSTRNLGPMLAWLPRGLALFVPAVYWEQLSHRERRTILRHELAHYERGDITRSCFVRLLALPFWFHPWTWQLVAWFDESAEYACDRVAAGPNDAIPYARALERLAAQPSAITLALGRSAQSHPLVQRVCRVLTPSPQQDSVMKMISTATALAALAFVSLVQIRLVAEDKSPATIESVKAEVKSLEGDLEDLKEEIEEFKKEAAGLKDRVESHLQSLKELASDPGELSTGAQKLVNEFKAGDEASKQEANQMAALDAAAKLDEEDERLLVCGFLAKESTHEAVRRKALEIAAKMGEEGLPVFAHAYESLPAADRLFALEELAKNKETHVAVFARLAHDQDEQIRVAAVTAGLKSEEPLVFLGLAVESNESLADVLFPRFAILSGEDLRLALFAAALKGPEKFLPGIVEKAAELKEDGYPIIAVIFQRKTAESRAAIMKAFAKSEQPLEKLIVEKALADEDATLREAAEKAK